MNAISVTQRRQTEKKGVTVPGFASSQETAGVGHSTEYSSHSSPSLKLVTMGICDSEIQDELLVSNPFPTVVKMVLANTSHCTPTSKLSMSALLNEINTEICRDQKLHYFFRKHQISYDTYGNFISLF